MQRLRFFEIARVFVRFNHIASVIVNVHQLQRRKLVFEYRAIHQAIVARPKKLSYKKDNDTNFRPSRTQTTGARRQPPLQSQEQAGLPGIPPGIPTERQSLQKRT
jgi:hypothetical protein